MPDPAEELRAVVQAFVRASGVLAADRTPCGQPLPPSYAHALLVLREGPAPTQAELGAALGIDKSNVTRLCRRMEAAGHLVREADPRDGRAQRLALTERGRALAAAVAASSRDRFARVLEALPEPDRPAVLAALRQLNRALGTLASAPDPENRP